MVDTTTEETEVLAIGFDTPDGPLRARISVSTGPIRFIDLVPPMHQFTEGVVGLAIRREKRLGFEISVHLLFNRIFPSGIRYGQKSC